jgi:hypothetical protein
MGLRSAVVGRAQAVARLRLGGEPPASVADKERDGRMRVLPAGARVHTARRVGFACIDADRRCGLPLQTAVRFAATRAKLARLCRALQGSPTPPDSGLPALGMSAIDRAGAVCARNARTVQACGEGGGAKQDRQGRKGRQGRQGRQGGWALQHGLRPTVRGLQYLVRALVKVTDKHLQTVVDRARFLCVLQAWNSP